MFVKLIGETGEVTKKQLQVLKESKGSEVIMDRPLSTTVEHFIKKNNDKGDEEAKQLKRQLVVAEPTYFTWVVKAYAESKNYAEVSKFIKMGPKKCPVPLATVAEICYKEGNKELAKDALIQIPKDHERIELLLEFQLWIPACNEMFRVGLHEDYIDELRSKAPSWIESDIQKELMKAASKK